MYAHKYFSKYIITQTDTRTQPCSRTCTHTETQNGHTPQTKTQVQNHTVTGTHRGETGATVHAHTCTHMLTADPQTLNPCCRYAHTGTPFQGLTPIPLLVPCDQVARTPLVVGVMDTNLGETWGLEGGQDPEPDPDHPPPTRMRGRTPAMMWPPCRTRRVSCPTYQVSSPLPSPTCCVWGPRSWSLDP